MVNGFFGMALLFKSQKNMAKAILDRINEANSLNNFSFFENFNSNSSMPNGVAFCAWSAAATILVHQSLYTNFKILL